MRHLLLLFFALCAAFVTIVHSVRLVGDGADGIGEEGGGAVSAFLRDAREDKGIPFAEAERRRQQMIRRDEAAKIDGDYLFKERGGGANNHQVSSGGRRVTKPFDPRRSKSNRGVLLRGMVIRDVAVATQRLPETTALTTTTTTTTTQAATSADTAVAVSDAIDAAAEWGSGDDGMMMSDANEGEEVAVSQQKANGAPPNGDPLASIFASCASASPRGPQQQTAMGPQRQCDPTRCRFCKHFPPHASPHLGVDVSPETLDYLSRHVLFAVVTGAFGNFTRLDLAYCTWLQHVPEANLYLVSDVVPQADGTDAVGDAEASYWDASQEEGSDSQSSSLSPTTSTAYRRRGQWLRGAVPSGHRFSKQQRGATTGYTIAWHMAQYRFMLGLDAMVRRGLRSSADNGEGSGGETVEEEGIDGLTWRYAGRDGSPEGPPYAFPARADTESSPSSSSSRSEGGGEYIKWAAVIDDDTFINLNALVVFFKRMDASAARIDAERRAKGQQQAGGDGSAATLASVPPDDLPDATPTYIGDNGWGGAGHFFSRAALKRARDDLYHKCVRPHMMGAGRASDEALKKCLPHLALKEHAKKRMKKDTLMVDDGEGVAAGDGSALVVASGAGSGALPLPRMRVVNDRLFSHCQANFLRRRLLRGDHISAHIKRDVTGPVALQALRARLYYQTTYTPQNATCAYALLMHFGACAYGSSCRIRACDEAHDARAIADYRRLLVAAKGSGIGSGDGEPSDATTFGGASPYGYGFEGASAVVDTI